MPLTPEDIVFLNDEETYSSGPTLDVELHPSPGVTSDQLLDLILRDPQTISYTATPTELTRLFFQPRSLPPIGMTFSFIEDHLFGFIYPPHLRRATGRRWDSGESYADPAVIALHDELIALVRRVHRRAALAGAVVMEEAWTFDATPSGIFVSQLLAKSAGWPHLSLDGEKHVVALTLD